MPRILTTTWPLGVPSVALNRSSGRALLGIPRRGGRDLLSGDSLAEELPAKGGLKESDFIIEKVNLLSSGYEPRSNQEVGSEGMGVPPKSWGEPAPSTPWYMRHLWLGGG